MTPHISLAAEAVFHIGPVAITNSILTSWLVSLLLIVVSLWAKNNVKNTKRPKGFQNFLEMTVETLLGLTDSITESAAKSKYIFPFVFSFFLFIVLNNWAGLLPGAGTIGFYEPSNEPAAATNIKQSPFIKTAHANEDSSETTAPTESKKETKTFVPYFRAGTADMNTTFALALISCFSTWFLGVKFLKLHYFDRFKNPLELISEISRIISFTFRLFGNVFAGEVLIAVMTSLVPIIVPSVFIAMEVFVGVLQAYIFAILTLIFMTLAMSSHGGAEHTQKA